MTIGEKIQFYRRKTGLSQEDLAKMMVLSRQTISLWEIDKTVPTLDNMIRLKEIFGVQIDDLLSDDSRVEEMEDSQIGEVIIDSAVENDVESVVNVEADSVTDLEAESPINNELYVFKYDKTDLNKVFKKLAGTIVCRALIYAGLIFTIIVIADDINDLLLGFLYGALLIGEVFFLKSYLSYRKAFKKSQRRMMDSVYSYEMFDDCFVLNIFRNGEMLKAMKIYFADFEKVNIFKDYIVLQAYGQLFIFKKKEIIRESKFYEYCEKHTAKYIKRAPKVHSRGGKRVASILLFIFSIASIVLAGILIGIFNGSLPPEKYDYMWVFWLFLPLPIASVAYGIYLKGKGFRFAKNVVAGVIMSVLLFLYGSMGYLSADMYSYTDEPILRAEYDLKIDIPEHRLIKTMDWSNSESSTPLRERLISTSDISFDADAVVNFENGISADEKWILGAPEELNDVISYYCNTIENHYFLIYNVDTGEFNTLPSEMGEYEFLNLAYNVAANTMQIVEFEIFYVAEGGK